MIDKDKDKDTGKLRREFVPQNDWTAAKIKTQKLAELEKQKNQKGNK